MPWDGQLWIQCLFGLPLHVLVELYRSLFHVNFCYCWASIEFSPLDLLKENIDFDIFDALVTFHCYLCKKWDSWRRRRPKMTTSSWSNAIGKKQSFGWRCKPLEAFLEIQPFQLEIQTHKSWLPPECQFYGDNPISYFPARHFQTLRSGKCF